MRSSRVDGWDLADCGWYPAELLERLTANAVVATVLGSIPASSVVDPEWFFSDPIPDPDPTFQRVPDPIPDPDPTPDPDPVW
jgi:hypothetical protein